MRVHGTKNGTCKHGTHYMHTKFTLCASNNKTLQEMQEQWL